MKHDSRQTTSDRSRFHACFNLFLSFLALLIAAQGAFAESPTLRLREEVYVKGPEVLLGDLAEIEGDNAAALAAIEVVSAALPGASKQVTASYVLSRLRNAGIEEEPRVTGADRVRILTEALTVEPTVIADDLRRFIEEEMPWDPVDAMVTVEAPASAVVLPSGSLDIAWRPGANYRYLGTGAFSGILQVDGRPEKSLLVKAEVHVVGPVILATRDIPRGRLIAGTDVEVVEQSLDERSGSIATSLDEVVGMIARQTIFPGETISLRNLEARTLVKRNQLVNVQLRRGSILIQTRALALNDARAGDLVVCANPATKKEFQGVALPDGTVLVE